MAMSLLEKSPIIVHVLLLSFYLHVSVLLIAMPFFLDDRIDLYFLSLLLALQILATAAVLLHLLF
jgi:hypothetical protein